MIFTPARIVSWGFTPPRKSQRGGGALSYHRRFSNFQDEMEICYELMRVMASL